MAKYLLIMYSKHTEFEDSPEQEWHLMLYTSQKVMRKSGEQYHRMQCKKLTKQRRKKDKGEGKEMHNCKKSLYIVWQLEGELAHVIALSGVRWLTHEEIPVQHSGFRFQTDLGQVYSSLTAKQVQISVQNSSK